MSSDAAIDAAEEKAGLKNPGYEIFIAALSVLSIVNLVLLWVVKDTGPRLRPDDHERAHHDSSSSSTSSYRLKTAPSKSDYFWRNWGWADLLASLPFQQTKILRLFRLIKVYRLLKDYGTKNIMRSLIKDKAGSALLMLLFIAILVLEFGSLAHAPPRVRRRRARTSTPRPTRSGTSS